MAKCAFGKVSILGTFEPIMQQGTELYCRLVYLENDDTRVLLAALDTSCASRSAALRFRNYVSEHTHIPADNIWFHELQIHAAPESPQMEEAVLPIAKRVVQETLAMMERAVPYTCRVAECDMGTRFSMNREQYVEGLGGVTVWAGILFDEKGTPYCNDPDRMLLDGYQPNLPVFEKPIYFDNTTDSKAYLFVFRDTDGKVIGTLSRFAAHPDVAVLFESHDVHDCYHYHYDWTGVLSTRLEQVFQAPSLYLNGPCGDLATKKAWFNTDTYEASDAECKRIGEEIAKELLDRYEKKTVALGDPDHLRAARFDIDLPMRDSFPHTYQDETLPAQIEAAQKARQDAVQNDAPAYLVKCLTDDAIRTNHNLYVARDQCVFTEEELNSRVITNTVSALQLGDYLFIGVPGESLVDMTMWLRSTFTGVKTIPVDQVNGYCGYMATPRTLTLGGYTYWSSWLGRDSIPTLKEGIVKAMDEWLDE